MAKLETTLNGRLEDAVARITQGMLAGSMSATLEDSSDYFSGNTKVAVRVFERYSAFGSNRVSMNVTFVQQGGGPVWMSAITSGGSQAMFFKINTVGEDAFLDKLRELL